MKTLLRGLATGMFLQMAVGPVFFYILSITLNSDIVAGVNEDHPEARLPCGFHEKG